MKMNKITKATKEVPQRKTHRDMDIKELANKLEQAYSKINKEPKSLDDKIKQEINQRYYDID